ncbi:TPA: hypothetical protein I2T40_00925 [Staphylococcus aureus]|nr:hypothetical protein [Staphylococcus aureus]HDG8499792.1 hypothetical protein [Staphylococcus aureus]HDG8588223.1 hypothetical protein [Staphylococcus aureus]HDZ3300372.1 hypothetical protein [Staphylococcus aureus]HDZ3316418.1 hypothetical protein [Staphylococcus aureus]
MKKCKQRVLIVKAQVAVNLILFEYNVKKIVLKV